MLTPERALVAIATAEDVFTPAGDAVVIAHIEAMPIPYLPIAPYPTGNYRFVATVYGTGNHGRHYVIDELTAREDITGGAE